MYKENKSLPRSKRILCDLKSVIYLCFTVSIIVNYIPDVKAETETALPEPPNCGPDHSGDKSYNGNDIAIDQYPWLAMLKYDAETEDAAFKCGGSLINQRYVLTAAHCVNENYPVRGIRLGEYDTKTEIDCKDDVCNNKVLDVGSEEIIIHPEYSPKKRNPLHDIALIRLAQQVNYTDFIRPVCLPLPATKQVINSGDLLTVAGWGRASRVQLSNVKQQANVSAVEQKTCAEDFAYTRAKISSTQICAGFESCQLGGAPLMRKAHKQHWYLEGIVSVGYFCNSSSFPTIYTRVSEYVDWIENTIKL